MTLNKLIPFPTVFKAAALRRLAQVFDDIVHALCIVDYAHHEIHEGDSYYLTNSAVLASTGHVTTIAFKTPAVSDPQKRMHLLYEVEVVGGGATFDILEDVTSVTGGAAIIPFNRLRGSAKVSTIQSMTGAVAGKGLIGDTLGSDPVVATGGTSIIPGGGMDLGNGTKDGGGSRGAHEVVLKPNSIYHLSLTTIANSVTCILHANWYEHTDSQW